jgi:Tfp pilus assembly protein PilV
MLTRLPHDDHGVTLMELLIAVLVSVMILLALSTSFVLLFQTNDISNHVEADSRSAQQIETLLPADFQSAFPGQIDTSSGPSTGCAGSSPGTNVLRMQWSQTAPSTVNFSVSYRLITSGSGSTADVMLARFFCSGASLAASTADELVLARELATTGTPAAAAYDVNTAPDAITLTITSGNGNTYTFKASKRTAGAAGSPTSPPSAPATSSPAAEVPAPVDADMLDTDSNGKPDQVKVNLSGAPAGTCTSGWTLAGIPAGGTQGATSVSGSTVTIAITEKATGTPNTDSAGLTVSFTPSGCTLAAASNMTVVDQASPILSLVATTQNGTSNGKMQTGDAVTFTFSEKVTLSATTTTVTESRSASDVTTLTIPNVLDSAATIDKSYLSGPNKTSVFNAVITGSGTANVTVTLGTCASGCTSQNSGSAATIVMVPASSIADLATSPNTVAATPCTSTNLRLF